MKVLYTRRNKIKCGILGSHFGWTVFDGENECQEWICAIQEMFGLEQTQQLQMESNVLLLIRVHQLLGTTEV